MARSCLRGGESADVLKFNAGLTAGDEECRFVHGKVGQSLPVLMATESVPKRPGSKWRVLCSLWPAVGPLEAHLHTIASV